MKSASDIRQIKHTQKKQYKHILSWFCSLLFSTVDIGWLLPEGSTCSGHIYGMLFSRYQQLSSYHGLAHADFVKFSQKK